MDTTCVVKGQRQTDCHTYLWNINHVGNEAKENTSEDFSTAKESGTVREA